jgi:hypothetical protein
MKSTPIHVCAKTAFVGIPSTESVTISYFRNFLSFKLKNKVFYKITTESFNHFRKYLELEYRKMWLWQL